MKTMSKEKLFDQPTFIISLDTESIWGYIAYPSSKTASVIKHDDTKGRGCIDTLLNLFKKHNIPATWAVVGHLFFDHCECEDGIPHKKMPRFKEDWYSSDPCTDIQRDPLYYGKDIVENILSNRIEHEIGYHSFSHVVFSECNREVAEAEIKKGNELAKEFERVLDQEGILLLLHLHNALAKNVAAGKPLSPSTWMGLFNLNVIALPEKNLIEDFILKDRLDLSKKYSEKELNVSDLSIIGGVDLDCFDGIWKDIFNIKENLIINPIYKMKERGDKILLEREFPSESFRKEYPLTEQYLPQKCTINKRLVKGRSVCVSDLDEIEDLMRKFVIINVPKNYIK